MPNKLLILIFNIFIFSYESFAQKPGALTALDLDGTDDYINVPDISALNPTGKITVEAWIKADAYATTNFGNSIFCKHGWASGNKGYVLRCGDNGKVNFNISNSSGVWVEAFTTSIMKTGVWYHVAGIFTGDSVNVYINGKLEATTLYTGPISPSTGLAAKIGDLAYTPGGTRLFNGQIDEVRVWNTALSKATLRNWMCRKVTSSHPNYGNLAVYYKLDEGTGSNAADKSGNANTGVLTNGPVWVNSGAALGDTSVYTYGGNAMEIQTKFGDIFSVKNISGAPAMAHLYLTYDTSVQNIKINTLGALDSTHFFGVYYEDNASVKFNINYNFKNLNSIIGIKKCAVNMFVKPLGNTGTWDYTPAKLYDGGDSLIIKSQVKNEFAMALYQTDSSKLMSSVSGKNWFCGGDSLLLMALGNDSFNYTWYKNGGLLSGKTKKTLWVNSVGDYKVKFTRRETTCSFLSSSMAIGSRSTSVSWTYSINTCQNSDSIKLTSGMPSGGFYSGKNISPNGYYHPKKAGAGTYTIYYNYIDTNNCVNKAPAAVTLTDTALLTYATSLKLCANSPNINLTIVTPKSGNYIGKGISSNVFSPVLAGIGTHSINYIYTKSNGCKSKAVINIIINKPDSTSIELKKIACQNDGSFKINTYPAGGELKGSAVVGQNFFPLFTSPGWQWVYYTITDSHQCEIIDSAKIYIAEVPVSKLSRLTSVCDNDKDFALTGGQPADSGKYWVENKINTKFSPSTMGKGVFKVEYKIINYFGCRDSASSTIRVNASPAKPVISIVKNTLSSSAIKGNQWLDKNGPIAGAIQQSFNPIADGYYFVKVTNDSNCSRISDSVQFMKVGVRQINKSTVFIYPNPSDNGMFYIEGLQNNSEIKVLDPVGKELFFYKNQNSKAIIDLSNFGKGTYIINVKIGGQWLNYRVMKI